MTLDNLLKIGQLKVHTASRGEIGDLLAAAHRNLTDARVESISTENRFDAAYKCIMQSALAALMASGYRPDTKKPGHHQTVIQSLPKTVGIAASRIAVLDALRNKRNLSDYTGKEIDPSSLTTCIDEAERLLKDATQLLQERHPDLF
jgi:uncharacterized protein (UPF0332 family)